MDKKDIPSLAAQSVLVESEKMPDDTPTVAGYEFGDGEVDYDRLLDSMTFTGFQATNFGLAVEEIRRMLRWRLSDEEYNEEEEADELKDTEKRAKVKCKIFLGYTSNLISSGVRETIRFLVQHKLVDVVVSTAGGIEEDLIKCLAPTYMGEFSLSGAALRSKGLNRIGNLLVPNENYCKFEDWMTPVLDAMLEEQRTEGTVWTPSKMIHRFGKEINDPSSVCYWAWKNNIPIYSPAITDGSIGDMLFFHSYSNPGLVVDLVGDIRGMNNEALYSQGKTGIIILGGGLVKHHICNANLMRNGADFAVFVNTGQEFDGSDSGARPDEAKSWGKIRIEATAVKVYADATFVFPLLVAQTFAKYHKNGTI